MRQRFVCWLIGHVPVWLDGVPSSDYRCDRCGRRIWFWSGQRTGWFLAPEAPPSRVVHVDAILPIGTLTYDKPADTWWVKDPTGSWCRWLGTRPEGERADGAVIRSAVVFDRQGQGVYLRGSRQ